MKGSALLSVLIDQSFCFPNAFSKLLFMNAEPQKGLFVCQPSPIVPCGKYRVRALRRPEPYGSAAGLRPANANARLPSRPIKIMKGCDSVEMKLGEIGKMQSMQLCCLPTCRLHPACFPILPISSRPEVSNQNASVKQWKAE